MSGETLSDMIVVSMPLIHIHAESLSFGFSKPLTLHCDSITPTCARVSGGVVYEVAYVLHVTDNRNKRVYNFECTYGLLLQVDAPPSDDELKDFAQQVIRFLHPYLTELMTSYTRDMGLPPLVLEIYKPPVPAP